MLYDMVQLEIRKKKETQRQRHMMGAICGVTSLSIKTHGNNFLDLKELACSSRKHTAKAHFTDFEGDVEAAKSQAPEVQNHGGTCSYDSACFNNDVDVNFFASKRDIFDNNWRYYPLV
ncbi:unnamed protein product [Lactuca saligna]|uniref:Uncharacterized protein n=1 Tax=Lactuca saligna TaxID=75948 RepID=A0AA35YYX8_LACSI|nr:unnamed protein product [Lactuca saligna]